MREALEMALQFIESNADSDSERELVATIKEALAQPEQWGASAVTHPEYIAEQKEKTQELRSMLAQPEQEPVAWMYESVCGNDFATCHKPPDYGKNIRPLYTTQPQRTWVGLTVEEVDNITAQRLKWQVADLVDAIEAKLKEKNT